MSIDPCLQFSHAIALSHFTEFFFLCANQSETTKLEGEREKEEEKGEGEGEGEGEREEREERET
jgi:hypothetical protein